MFPPTLWIGIGLHKGGDSVARLASADLSIYAVLNPALDSPALGFVGTS